MRGDTEMVKRILIALCLFMPLFTHAEAKQTVNPEDVIILGRDLDEKNIPLDLGKMEKAFEKGFSNAGTAFTSLKDAFYGEIYEHCTVPFSVRELFNACFSSTNMAGECTVFLKKYMELIVKKRKFLPVYRLY